LTDDEGLVLMKIKQEQIINLINRKNKLAFKAEKLKTVEDWSLLKQVIKANFQEISKDLNQISESADCLVIRESGQILAFCIYHRNYSWSGRYNIIHKL